MGPSPSPSPLQSVLLYQHHQTTTPYAPGIGPATVTAAPLGAQKESPVKEKEREQKEEEKENGEEEENDDEEH